jgi:hypothetical protein
VAVEVVVPVVGPLQNKNKNENINVCKFMPSMYR